MKIKIFTAPTEIDASIVKGVLQNESVPSSVVPGERITNFTTGVRPNAPHDVLVEDKDREKALEVLRRMQSSKTGS